MRCTEFVRLVPSGFRPSGFRALQLGRLMLSLLLGLASVVVQAQTPEPLCLAASTHTRNTPIHPAVFPAIAFELAVKQETQAPLSSNRASALIKKLDNAQKVIDQAERNLTQGKDQHAEQGLRNALRGLTIESVMWRLPWQSFWHGGVPR